MESRYCTRCKRTLPLSEFSRNRSKANGYNSICKECVRSHSKQYYRENKEKLLVRSKAYYCDLEDYINSIKTPCVKCGESRVYLIQFHHIDPTTKLFNIGARRRSKDNIASEAKKCVCLCSNCHDEFHYFYGLSPDNPKESLEEYLGYKF